MANLHLKFDSPEQALQQAVFSRGDRRLAPLLLDMGSGRASFKQALRRHHIDPWQYAVRIRTENEHLCWDVLDHGIRSGFLFQEYQRGLGGAFTPPCKPSVCRRCGVCGEETL